VTLFHQPSKSINLEPDLLLLNGMANGGRSRVKTFQLSIYDFKIKSEYDYSELKKSTLYKCTRTLKPWKYWVLDPNKLFWLKLISELESQIGLLDKPIIMEQRLSVPNKLLEEEILKSYARHLLGKHEM
jgi:hypothetical protein